ncbi:MAG: SDR family oxidoreductase [Mucilaginibacter sp.]|uniref:SDR family oxidoreductase n=1 Tax=Mucilaginibacter sp. TaxID=1882438 RepID=UPI0034E57DE8
MKKILVIGASGFVGKNLAQQLLADGYTVRCLARNPSKVQFLADAGCEIVQGDISDLASIQNAVKSVDAVYISVHTISAQPANTESKGFMDVEMSGIQNIVAACKMYKVNRVIYVTFLGTDANADSAWIRGRWQTEQYLLKSGLDATIIRPGMIVGIGGQGYNSVVGNAKRRFAMILGNGKPKFRSIAVTDLAYYLVGVLNDPRTFGQAYDVGGKELLTIPQMVDLVAEVLGRPHPKKIHIPVSLLGLFSPLIERMGKMPKGAMKGLVDSIKADAIGDPSPIIAILPRPLLSFRQASEKALG